MNTIRSIIFISLFISDCLGAQNYFANEYTVLSPFPRSIQMDNGLICFTGSINGDQAMRIDDNGNVIWAKTYIDSLNQDIIVYNTLRYSDNCIYGLLSHNYTLHAEGLARLDSSGNIVWAKYYVPLNNSTFNDIALCTPNKICIACDSSLIILDTNGIVLTRKKFTSPNYGYAGFMKVVTSRTGDIYALGIVDLDPSFLNQRIGMFVAKLDSSLNLSWYRLFGTTGNLEGAQIRLFQDTALIITGTEDTSFLSPRTFYAQLDTSGNIALCKTYNPISVRDMIVDSTGNIWMLGVSYHDLSNTCFCTDNVLLETNLQGDTLFAGYFGSGPVPEFGSNIVVNSSMNTCYLTSYALLNGHDLIIQKMNTNSLRTACLFSPYQSSIDTISLLILNDTLDELSTSLNIINSTITTTSVSTTALDYCAELSIPENNSVSVMNLSPNPCDDHFTMQLQNVRSEKFLITDQLGRTVGLFDTVNGRADVSTIDLPEGVYFILSMNDPAISGKLIVSHF